MEDTDIIRLYFERDENAIAETDAAHGRDIFRLSLRILASQEDAEENQNDTYLKAWQTIPPVKPFSLRAYLLKICRSRAFDRLDREKAKKRHGEVVALTEEMERCIPDGRQEDMMEAKELGRLINRFLDTLPDEHRDILIARCFELESIPAIASDYGFSETKVRSILFRVRKHLKEYLESEGFWI